MNHDDEMYQGVGEVYDSNCGCDQSPPVVRKPVHDAIRDFMRYSFGITSDFQMSVSPYKGKLYVYVKVEDRSTFMVPAQGFFNDMMAWEVTNG